MRDAICLEMPATERGRTLVIFDNDGTLCDSQHVEGLFYAAAIESVTGMARSDLDWTQFEERTSSAVVRQLLAGDDAWAEKEERIKHEFCRLLRGGRAEFPGDFSPIAGALEFIERLQAEGFPVAIATGGFDTEAALKLQCCGIDLHAFPHATASDTPKRKDIIRLAAARAGVELDSVVYFGDAPWDVRASTELEVPMIGIGRRWKQLRELGVPFAFRDYSAPDRIMSALDVIRTRHLRERSSIEE